MPLNPQSPKYFTCHDVPSYKSFCVPTVLQPHIKEWSWGKIRSKTEPGDFLRLTDSSQMRCRHQKKSKHTLEHRYQCHWSFDHLWPLLIPKKMTINLQEKRTWRCQIFYPSPKYFLAKGMRQPCHISQEMNVEGTTIRHRKLENYKSFSKNKSGKVYCWLPEKHMGSFSPSFLRTG